MYYSSKIKQKLPCKISFDDGLQKICSEELAGINSHNHIPCPGECDANMECAKSSQETPGKIIAIQLPNIPTSSQL